VLVSSFLPLALTTVLVGSRHQDFSDYAVLPISGTKIGHLILSRISDLMLAFLNDKLEETIAAVPTTDLEESLSVEKDGKSKRKLLGNPGDVIIE
jgi:platelet-activating factor acetylhydrolase